MVYSQGELAEIGKQAGKKAQLTDLLQFVNPAYKREDDRLAQDIETAKGGVKTAIQRLTDRWRLQAKLRQLKTNRSSLTQRVEALEKTLPKQSEEDQAVVDYFDKANAFDTKRIQASKHADQILNELEASATELLNECDLKLELTSDNEADAIQRAYGDLYKIFSAGIKKFRDELKTKRDVLTSAETAWAGKSKARVIRAMRCLKSWVSTGL